jgi:hypothetical protein
VAVMVDPSAGEPSSTSIGVDVVESLPLVLKEKETEEKNLDDEMNGAAGKVSDDGAAQDDSMGVLWRGGGGGGGVSFASPKEGNLYKKLFRDKKAPLDYDMVLVRSNNNPKATDILERLDRANGKTVGYAMGQLMYDNNNADICRIVAWSNVVLHSLGASAWLRREMETAKRQQPVHRGAKVVGPAADVCRPSSCGHCAGVNASTATVRRLARRAGARAAHGGRTPWLQRS